MDEAGREPFRVGRVLGRTFALWARHLPLLLALVCVVMLPLIGYGAYRAFGPPEERPPPAGGEDEIMDSFARELLTVTVRGLAGGLLDDLAQALVIVVIFGRLRGRATGFGKSLRAGLRRIVPVLRIALVLWCATFLVSRGLLVLFYRAVAEFLDPEDLLRNFWIAALLADALALLVVQAPLWMALPAAVVEKRGPYLWRGLTLTRGNRLGVFLALLAVYLLGRGLTWAHVHGLPDLPRWGHIGVGLVQSVVLTALWGTLAAVLYHTLRGADTTELEGVFE